MFKIDNIVLFHNDIFTFYYIQSVPHPGNFWSRYTGLGCPKNEPKKSSSTPPRSFFFIKDKLISFVLRLLKVGHLACLLLSQVWYGRRKPWRFHAKRKEKQQPEPPCAIATSYQTCNRWPFKKTWTLFIRVPEQLISVRISCLGDGGWTVIKFFLLLLSFPSRKK